MKLTLLLTTYYEKETDQLCTCSGDFYKGCPLRAASDLPCQQSVVRISPMEKDELELDKSLDQVMNTLSRLNKGFKI